MPGLVLSSFGLLAAYLESDSWSADSSAPVTSCGPFETAATKQPVANTFTGRIQDGTLRISLLLRPFFFHASDAQGEMGVEMNSPLLQL